MAAEPRAMLSEAAQRWLQHFGCKNPRSVAVLFESGRISDVKRPPGLTLTVVHELKRYSGDPNAQPFLRPEPAPVRMTKIVGYWHCGNDEHTHLSASEAEQCMKGLVPKRTTLTLRPRDEAAGT